MEHALFREYPAAWLDLPLPRLVWGGSKSRVLLKAPPVVLGGHGVYGGTVTSPNRHGGISRTHTASHILGPLSSGGSCPSPYCKPRNASKLSNPTPYRKRLKHSHQTKTLQPGVWGYIKVPILLYIRHEKFYNQNCLRKTQGLPSWISAAGESGGDASRGFVRVYRGPEPSPLFSVLVMTIPVSRVSYIPTSLCEAKLGKDN